jgi:hypothetical protein
MDPIKHLIAIAERERQKRRHPAPARSARLSEATQATPGQEPPRESVRWSPLLKLERLPERARQRAAERQSQALRSEGEEQPAGNGWKPHQP